MGTYLCVCVCNYVRVQLSIYLFFYLPIYILYVHIYIYMYELNVKSLSRFRSNFFKIIYEVICIINFKNTLFKRFTRGDPWAPSIVKQNLNRTQKYKVIAFKKRLLRTLQGGSLGFVLL
jgi:hypothetical protein